MESLTTKLKSTEEALKASRAECDVKGYLQCKDELKVSSGAAKQVLFTFLIFHNHHLQLEVELGNSFARVEVLSSEIKQLKTIIEEFENKAKHTQAELDALVLSTSSSSFLQFCQKLETQFKNFGPYWRSFKESSLTALESARQHPMTQKALGVLSRFGEQGKQVFNELYLKAEPHVTAAYKTGKQYGQVAFAKTNEVYILAKPAIDRSIKTSKEITLQGAAIARTYSYQVATVLREKSVEFYESQFVADLKKQSVETVGEIEDYVRNQMDQIPALQPFAKTQYALLITYTLLSLPVLVVLTILMSFCGGPSTKSAEAKTPVPKKTKPASKKPKKSRNT